MANHIRDAAKAHTNLTMFHAIMSLCESGCFYGAPTELPKIIALAKAGAGKQLSIYDRERAKALRALAADEGGE